MNFKYKTFTSQGFSELRTVEIRWVEYEKYANQQFPIGMRCNEYNTKCTYVHVTSLPTAAEAVRAWWVQKDSRENEYLAKNKQEKFIVWTSIFTFFPEGLQPIFVLNKFLHNLH